MNFNTLDKFFGFWYKYTQVIRNIAKSMIKEVVSYGLCLTALFTSIGVSADMEGSECFDCYSLLPKNESLQEYFSKQSRTPMNTLTSTIPSVREESVDAYYKRNNMTLYRPRLRLSFDNHKFRYNWREDKLTYEYGLTNDTAMLIQKRHDMEYLLFRWSFE